MPKYFSHKYICHNKCSYGKSIIANRNKTKNYFTDFFSRRMFRGTLVRSFDVFYDTIYFMSFVSIIFLGTQNKQSKKVREEWKIHVSLNIRLKVHFFNSKWIQKKKKKLNFYKMRWNWVFATYSNLLIPVSLQPFQTGDLTEFNEIAQTTGVEYQSLWQRLKFFTAS